jgi:hypothetical protein
MYGSHPRRESDALGIGCAMRTTSVSQQSFMFRPGRWWRFERLSVDLRRLS